MSNNNIITQVDSLPHLIRTQTSELNERVCSLFSKKLCSQINHIITTGCGDSHMAAIATELAFEELTNISTEPLNALTASRYALATGHNSLTKNTLVIGTSVSGTVVRTREALGIAREQGMITVAITANPTSPFGTIAQHTLDCTVPDFIDFPGVRSYRTSMIVLYLIAIRIAEAKDIINTAKAHQLRSEIISTGDAIEATIEANRESAIELARNLTTKNHFVFVGHGPNYATAMFGAAKLLEAAGTHALAQDTEEWGHLQYFTNTDVDTPTFIVSPGMRSHKRAAEMLIPIKRIGRYTIGVCPTKDDTIGNKCDVFLPVIGDVPEIFSPIVYPTPIELFADYLALNIGEEYFRGFEGLYDVKDLNPLKGNSIRTSKQATLQEILKNQS